MSDNVTIAGRAIAADEATVEGATVLVPREKVGYGDPGSYTDVSALNPLPVTTPGDVALGTTADTATANTIVGRLKAIANALATTASNFLAVRLTDGGSYIGSTAQRLWVSDGGQALSTAPTGAGDVVGTLTNGRASVTTPGTPVSIVGSSTPCKWVTVTARTSNAQQINVGGTGVLATSGSTTGIPLTAGQSVTFPVSNANLVYIDARAAGEGVDYLVGT